MRISPVSVLQVAGAVAARVVLGTCVRATVRLCVQLTVALEKGFGRGRFEVRGGPCMS